MSRAVSGSEGVVMLEGWRIGGMAGWIGAPLQRLFSRAALMSFRLEAVRVGRLHGGGLCWCCS